MTSDDMEADLSNWLEASPHGPRVWVGMMHSLVQERRPYVDGQIPWAHLALIFRYAKKYQHALPPYISELLFGRDGRDPKLKRQGELEEIWDLDKGNWANLLLNCCYSG
jgi:hypothetical protein